MTHCPNCGYPVEPDAKICPHCDADLLSVWPPPPEGFTAPAFPSPPKTLTGRAWTDLLLGAAGQYLTHLAIARYGLLNSSTDPVSIGASMIMEFFLACVCGALGYFGLRKSYLWVAMGSGYATLVLFVIILGALFTCRTLPF